MSDRDLIADTMVKVVAVPVRRVNRQRRFRKGSDPYFDGPMPISKFKEIEKYVKVNYPLVDCVRQSGLAGLLLTLTHPSFPSACFPTGGHYDDFVLCIEQMFQARTVVLEPHDAG